ncbi:MAG: hypothetical protein NUV57_01755, partial [archaeon]|nr:hypothetical protein [archaeon]
IKAILEEEILGEKPQIEFLGLFQDGDREAKVLTAGNIYKARFKISVPTESNYEQLGFFVRTGNEALVEKDDFYIESINAPDASIIKGRTFSPPKGSEEDNGNVTNNEAKWAIATWNKDEIEQGIYIAEATIIIRESTTPGKYLPIFYRAFAITGNGEVIRDPFDSQLGKAEEISLKEGLYAEAYERGFNESALEECDEDFCFSNNLLDVKEDLFVIEPFDVRIFGDYELEFNITNDSETIHNNAFVRISNSIDGVYEDEKLKIQNYTFTNADSQEFGSDVPTFKLDQITLGDFRKSKTVKAKLSLRPEVIGKTAILVQIVSDRQLVFEKSINFNVVKKEDLNVAIQPETMPAFTEFDLNISARLFKTDEDFDAVKDALVRVERITPDREKIVFVATTDGEGKAVIRIPASEPNTIIKIRVEKEGLAAKTFKFKVSDKILEFNPMQLESVLDLTSNNEEQLDLEIKNLVPVTLHLSQAKFRINSLGLLDILKMNNWMSQYVNDAKLPHNFSSKLQVLTSISEDAKLIPEAKQLKGNLFVEVANADESISWPMEVPIKITINLAEPPKNLGCLEVSLKEWKDSTLGGKAEVEFVIRNNCITQKNQPLDLRNLQAKIIWKSNKIGNVELKVLDPETNQEASSVLTDGIYSKLFDLVPAEKEYIGLLVFTPNGGTLGETAEFEVIIDAAQLTNAGEQLVGASNSIASKINIIDLSQCIQYTPDAEAGLIIEAGQEEGTMEIDISNCGNVNVDFWMCKDDKGCSGGVEGAIRVSPEQFSLSPLKTKQSLRVSRDIISGIYGAQVHVRTPGSNYRKISTIDVIVKPDPLDAFEISKYEFIMIGAGSKDSALLTNKYLAEEVAVTASVCDWGLASEPDKMKEAAMKGGIGAAAGALSGIGPALQASKVAAQAEAAASATQLKAAQEASKTAQEASKVAKGTGETMCTSLQTTKTSVPGAITTCNKPFSIAIGTAADKAGPAALTAAEQCETALNAQKGISNEFSITGDKLNEGTLLTDFFSGTPALSESTISAATAGEDITTKESLIQEIAAQLEIAATSLEAGSAAIVASIAACTGPQILVCKADIATCSAAIGTATGDVQKSVAEVESYSGKELLDEKTASAAVKESISKAQESIQQASVNMNPAVQASQLAGSANGLGFGGIMATSTIGGFLIGGLSGFLFGQDPCAQQHTANLPDYVINVLTDAVPLGIKSENKNFRFSYDIRSARIVGNYAQQTIGIVATNLGIEDPEPVYTTATFNIIQHIHSNPTEVDNDNFGPFNVPDRKIQKIEQKVHLKIKTQEPEETLPDLTFDTLSCVSGNKIGRTGSGALPKVKMNWGFGANGINQDSCAEESTDGVYCDATQFSVMLSQKMNSLMDFFNVNPVLQCPANPLAEQFDSINANLGVSSADYLGEECYLPVTTGILDGRPAIMNFVDATNISGTQEIGDATEFEKTIHFNALLMRDAFSDDFQKDFARYYSDQRFFDTPEWFYGVGLDSSGKSYGIARLFEEGRITFTNKFFDSEELSSAGVYDVLINITSNDGTYKFFNSNGEPNVQIEIQFQLLQEPNPNSAFYSMPLDGLVGLDGDSFNRNGYGVSFENTRADKLITISNEAEPVRTYNDAGSNPIVFVNSSFIDSFYALNTSPSERGNLLEVEKISGDSSQLKFSPSKATPVLMKISADQTSDEELSVFYTVSSNNVPLEVGSSLTFWDGAGACLDPQGVLITESFDQRPDRSADSRDNVLNWRSAYGTDFGSVLYTGDTYLRTVFYTDPHGEYSLNLELPLDNAKFLTPDEEGIIVPLEGIGKELTTVNSIEDVFNLVEKELVCVTDSGRKASFFWNPKTIYDIQGKQRNISEFSNSLTAGETCIGLGD